MTTEANTTSVLIVEDDAFLANIYKTKFEMEGFKVSVSENGEAGLEDAKKKSQISCSSIFCFRRWMGLQY